VDTQNPLHATQLAQEAAEQGYGCVIAAGGDGTASEVVNGLMHAQVRPLFGVLPWGTSNDFFVALQATERMRQDTFTQPLDVGQVTFDGIVRYSCLSVSIGLSSWANEQYQNAVQRFGRRFAHLPAAISTLLSYKFPSKVQIVVDNGQSEIKPMLFMALSNTPSVAGGVRLAPDAKIDDGLFDVIRVVPIPLWQLGYVLLRAQLGLPLRSRVIEMQRVHDIFIAAEKPFPIHLDGELIPELHSQATHLSLHVMPAALQVVIPSLLSADAPDPVSVASVQAG
jgi:diacylglycerol kinase (ATP)